MKKLLLIVCAAGLFTMCASAASGTLIINAPATPFTGNCYPFGCGYTAQYQQVYASGQFTSLGAITITQLLFYNTAFQTATSVLNSGTWIISLSTTSASTLTLSPTYAANIGADHRQVFNGNLTQPWAFGNTLTITLSTPFTYDPSQGNLLLDIVASGISSPGGNVFFDGRQGGAGGPVSRVSCPDGVSCGAAGTMEVGLGLVTGFVFVPAPPSPSPTPLPSTLSLILIGLCLVVAYRARQGAAPVNRLS